MEHAAPAACEDCSTYAREMRISPLLLDNADRMADESGRAAVMHQERTSHHSFLTRQRVRLPDTADSVARMVQGLLQHEPRQITRFGWLGRPGLMVAVAIAASASVPALATASGGGWDVSWPQCTGPSSSSVVALPGSPQIGIVGVNDGRPFSTNPCLKAELGWAGAAVQLYVNTNNPGPGTKASPNTHWPKTTQTSPKPCIVVAGTTATTACAYDYGWNAAVNAYGTVNTALGSTNPAGLRWWLDVERVSGAPGLWQSSAATNTQAINGWIGYLVQQHVASIGIYANRNDLHTLFTPAQVPAGTLGWLATGAAALAGGLSYCNYTTGLTPSELSLVQYWPSPPALDADAICVGYISGALDLVAGVPASGLTVHLLHPAPVGGVTLTLSSSSSAARFAASGPAGAASPRTLVITIPATKNTATFSYRDTHAGYPAITALGTLGRIASVAAVTPGPLNSLAISPGSLRLAVGASHSVTATGADAFGNAEITPPAATWSVRPTSAATISHGPAGRVVVRGLAAARVTVTATLGSHVAYRTLQIVPAARTASGHPVTRSQIAAFVVTHYAYANWRHAAAYWASAATRNPARVASMIARGVNAHVSAAQVAAFVAAHYAPAKSARVTRALLALPAARQLQILARSVFPARLGPWRSRPAHVRAGYSAKKIGGLWWEVLG